MPRIGAFVFLRQDSGTLARHRVVEDRGATIVVRPPFQGSDVVFASQVERVDESQLAGAPTGDSGP